MPPDLLHIIASGFVSFADTDDEDRTYLVRLAPEQVETGDGRIMLEGSLSWRDGRLPVTFSNNEQSHGDAVFVGNLDNIRFETTDDVKWVVADLDWDDQDENESAREARRLVDEDRMRGVSVHLADMDAEYICREEDEDGWCIDGLLEVSAAQIASVTILMIPAFEDAEIIVNDSDGVPVAASISLRQPPREWFDNPRLDAPSNVTVTDDGRIFGHLALWDSCYRGLDDVCLTPPRDATNYREFHRNASIAVDDGTTINVGCITMGTEHAPVIRGLSAEQRARHYADEGLTVAYVRVGQDEHGVWVAGSIRTGVTDDQIDTLRRHRLSGDWHPLGSEHFLIAALVVNVPGFPIAASIRHGEQVSYFTAGPLTVSRETLVEDEVDPSGLALVAAALEIIGGKVDKLATDVAPVVKQAQQSAQQRELADVLGSFDEG